MQESTYRCTASGITSAKDIANLARTACFEDLLSGSGGGEGHGAEEGNSAEDDGGELHFDGLGFEKRLVLEYLYE